MWILSFGPHKPQRTNPATLRRYERPTEERYLRSVGGHRAILRVVDEHLRSAAKDGNFPDRGFLFRSEMRRNQKMSTFGKPAAGRSVEVFGSWQRTGFATV